MRDKIYIYVFILFTARHEEEKETHENKVTSICIKFYRRQQQ